MAQTRNQRTNPNNRKKRSPVTKLRNLKRKVMRKKRKSNHTLPMKSRNREPMNPRNREKRSSRPLNYPRLPIH